MVHRSTLGAWCCWRSSRGCRWRSSCSGSSRWCRGSGADGGAGRGLGGDWGHAGRVCEGDRSAGVAGLMDFSWVGDLLTDPHALVRTMFFALVEGMVAGAIAVALTV